MVGWEKTEKHGFRWQELRTRDFDPAKTIQNGGMLSEFPILKAGRMGQKIRRSAAGNGFCASQWEGGL